MTEGEIRERIAGLQAYVESEERSIAQTIKTYGTGVRPSWVSADIAIDQGHVDRAKAEIAELQAKL